MKKYIIILICSFCLLLLIGCSNNKTTYNLTRIKVREGVNGEITSYDIETFKSLYPGEIEKIGEKIIIENDNNIFFNGKESKNISSSIEMVDVGHGEIYISFKNLDFYDYFDDAEIYYYDEDKKVKELYITSYLKQFGDNQILFAFIFKNSN